MLEDDFLNTDRTFLLFSLGSCPLYLDSHARVSEFFYLSERTNAHFYLYLAIPAESLINRFQGLIFITGAIGVCNLFKPKILGHCFIWAGFTGCNYLTIPDSMSHDTFLDRQISR